MFYLFENEIVDVPDGVRPLFNFIDTVFQEVDKDIILLSDDFQALVSDLEDDLRQIYPDYIVDEFLQVIAFLQDNKSVERQKVMERIVDFMFVVNKYHEAQETQYDSEDDDEVDQFCEFCLSSYIVRRINNFCRKIGIVIEALEIREFILDQDGFVDKSGLFKVFGKISDFKLSIVLLKGDIVNFGKTFLAVKNITDNVVAKDLCCSILLDKEQHLVKELYDVLRRKQSSFLADNYIKTPTQLYMIASFLWGDAFNFSWPYISNKNHSIKNQNELILEFVSSCESINISKLLQFAKQNEFAIPRTIDFLDSLNDYVVFKSKYELVNLKKINLKKKDIALMELLIKRDLIDKNGNAIRDLSVITGFPKLSVTWDEWLIYSVIRKYMPDLYVSISSTQFRFSVPVVALNCESLNKAKVAARNKYGTSEIEEIVLSIDDLDNIDNLIEDYIEFDFDEDLI